MHSSRKFLPVASAAAFASALACALLSPSCGDSGSSSSAHALGERLYREKGCVACHGSGGEGTFLGPPLRNLAANWKAPELAEFLANPADRAAKDPRLKKLAGGYRMPMTPIAASEEERLAMANAVLAWQ